MESLYKLLALSLQNGTLKKIIFSKSENKDVVRETGVLCAFKGENTLALEKQMKDGKVFHQKIRYSDLSLETMGTLFSDYGQINLISPCGDVEWKKKKDNTYISFGYQKCLKFMQENTKFTPLDLPLNHEKQYILKGNEEFLKVLGVSDSNGRIYDKKQSKYRQINRFLEHVEEIVPHLPVDGKIVIYDLCCGKSYLSFAVYYYFTEILHREVEMLGIDRKADVMEFCNEAAQKCHFDGLKFFVDDVRNTPKGKHPHLVMSLHACDVATDIVLETACILQADVILSTPCCHRHMNDYLVADSFAYLDKFPFLRNKLCEVLTDSLRVLNLKAYGYQVTASELIDPGDTPKNLLIRGVFNKQYSAESPKYQAYRDEYNAKLYEYTKCTKEDYFRGILS